MALSDTDNCRAEWKKWLIAIWAFLECMVFAGILLGWGSLVFVLKEEGIFSDLCPSSGAVRTYDNTSKSTETSHLSTTNNMTVPTEDAHEPDLQAIDSENVADERDRNQCGIQDDRLALCFTIASAIFCIGGAIMGQINFKFGTRVTRVLGL